MAGIITLCLQTLRDQWYCNAYPLQAAVSAASRDILQCQHHQMKDQEQYLCSTGQQVHLDPSAEG
jgi:hypothetical protein